MKRHHYYKSYHNWKPILSNVQHSENLWFKAEKQVTQRNASLKYLAFKEIIGHITQESYNITLVLPKRYDNIFICNFFLGQMLRGAWISKQMHWVKFFLKIQ